MSDENEPGTFEEALECYREYRTRFEQLENEFDEYQQSSLNYEQELEVQLKQFDNQTHRLQQDLFLERTQNEQYRERSDETIKQFDHRFDQIQEELINSKNLNIKLTQYIRELEQTNDDLERSKRTLLDSLSTFETKLNYALEQNALLENELDDKKQLTETVQRLRDETRDLREELNVLHKTKEEKTVHSIESPIVNSNRMQSILSEAAAAAAINSTSTHKKPEQETLTNGDSKTNPSTSKQRKCTTTADLQMSQSNDLSQLLSNSTRLESLKLIKEAFRRFGNIESTLSTQRKQFQTATHTRYNSGVSATYPKNNEVLINQTQS